MLIDLLQRSGRQPVAAFVLTAHEHRLMQL